METTREERMRCIQIGKMRARCLGIEEDKVGKCAIAFLQETSESEEKKIFERGMMENECTDKPCETN